jgi:hypothetical protein
MTPKGLRRSPAATETATMNEQQATIDRIAQALAVLRTRLPLVPDYEDDLTTVEVRSHQAMEQHLNYYKQNAPGFENAFMMLSAPQIGVRHTRRLKGVGAVLRSQWPDGVALPDEVGVSPAVSPAFPNLSIPYSALVPASLDGLLAPGRHLSCDKNSHGFMREIPQCWITGQAAGVAAALAVAQGVAPRAVDIAQLQSRLQKQGVYLRPQATTSVRPDTVTATKSAA